MGETGKVVILDELVGRAERWLELDPDPETRAELEDLLARADRSELAERFAYRLEFGTAGLRGALGAGPNRMNRLVVRQAAAGVISYLGPGSTVVIGFDARHRSDVFAEDTARVVAAAGGRPILLPGPHPTPLVPFAVLHLGADAGVMVTASHNPRQDNGYKVYLGDGAQIVPPHDREISALIAAAAEGVVDLSAPDDRAIERLDRSIFEAYLEMVDRARLVSGDVHPLRVVYTAMHGVGRDLLRAAFERAGFAPPIEVAEQVEPDPDFPTVAFPNPEEPGALDLAIALAESSGADLVLANDPDADRLGVAVPANGRWRALTGNEVGALLADHILRHTSGDDRLVVTTVVSSRLLSRLAAAAGVRYAETLTGFKWIVRPGLEDPSLHFVFGYEEALGYAVTARLRDKDGISAAVLFVEAASELAAAGRTVLDRLDELAVHHGLHAGESWSLRFETAAAATAVMRALRESPPVQLGGQPVASFEDLAEGGELPPTDAVRVLLDDGGRVLVRPSGTEPKVKCYVEVVEPVEGGDVTTARSRAAERIAALRRGTGQWLVTPVP